MSEQNNPYEQPRRDDDVFFEPPTDAFDDFDLPEPPKWPKIVGLTSIILGGIGVTCTGLSAGVQLFITRMMSSSQSGFKGGLPPALTNPTMIQYVAGGVGLLWTILLIVGGALTLARKPTARTVMLVWAVGAIVIFVWGVSMQLQAQQEIADWVAKNPDADFAKQVNAGGSGGAIGQIVALGIGAIFGLLWPMFSLVFFGVVKTKSEQFTGGAADPAA